MIERHARRVIFLDGWEYSNGCSLEFEIAQGLGLDCVDETLKPLSPDRGLGLIEIAIEQLFSLGINAARLVGTRERLGQSVSRSVSLSERRLYKDEVLDYLASTSNVAQFVSFAPGFELKQRYCRLRGLAPNHPFESPREAISKLLRCSPEGTVNIRSFNPLRPEGNPFLQRLGNVEEVENKLKELGTVGLYTIVNETIDESDGGVSGVSYRGIIEFAPDATPRCVDDETVQTSAFPFEIGMNLLTTVYGFEPDLRGREGARIEFSIHPKPRGWMQNHTIIWQSEQRPARELTTSIAWPNRFSWFLGDKTFGLAVASAAGLAVPRTTVFGRRFFTFVFGESTGSSDLWTRPCPAVKTPGYYPSVRGWRDPCAVLDNWQQLLENAAPTSVPVTLPPLASVLVQQAISAEYSGKVVPKGQHIRVEGVRGEGDTFMLGEKGPELIPPPVEQAVASTYCRARDVFGPVQIEWVFDGETAWIVQVNRYDPVERNVTLDETKWVTFQFAKGRLEDFRREVISLQGTNRGIIVIGNVSPLSHLGEIAEVYGVPVHFEQK